MSNFYTHSKWYNSIKRLLMTEELRIAINSKDAITAAKNLDNLSKTAGKTEVATEKLSKKTDRLAKSKEDLAKSSDKAIAKFEIFNTKNIVVTAGITLAIDKLTKYADAYTGLSSRIKLTTDDINLQAYATDKLYTSSQRTRMSFAGTADLYSRLSIATKDMNLSQKDSLNLTETINKAMKLSGGTAESMNAAVIQLGQAFSADFKSVGQELASLREQTPALYKAIVDGTGLSSKAFRKAAEDGQLSSEIIIKAIKRSTESIDTEFKKIGLRIDESKVVFENSFIKIVGEFDKATGASQALSSAIIDMSKYLDGIDITATIEEFSKYKDIIELIGLSYVSYVAYMKVAMMATAAYTAAQKLLTSSTVTYNIATNTSTTTVKSLTAAQVLATVGTKALSTAMKAIPAVAVASGILAIANHFTNASNNADKFTNSIGKTVDELSKLTKAQLQANLMGIEAIKLEKSRELQLLLLEKKQSRKNKNTPEYIQLLADIDTVRAESAELNKTLETTKETLKNLTALKANANKQAPKAKLEPLVEISDKANDKAKKAAKDFANFKKQISLEISVLQTEDELRPYKALEEAYKLDMDKWSGNKKAQLMLTKKYNLEKKELDIKAYQDSQDALNKIQEDTLKQEAELRNVEKEKLELLSKENELKLDRNSDDYELQKAQEEVNLRAEILNLYMGTTDEIEKQTALTEALNKLQDVKPKIKEKSQFEKSLMTSKEYKDYLVSGGKNKAEAEKEDESRYSNLGDIMGQSFSDVFMQTVNGGSFKGAMQQALSTGGNQLISSGVSSMANSASSSLASMTGMSPMMGGVGVGLAMGVAGALLEKPQETLISSENFLEKLTASNKAILEETKAFRILNKIFGTDYKAEKSTFLEQYKQGYTLNTNVGDGMQNYIESLFKDIENATMSYTVKVGEQTIQKTKSGFLGIGASSSTEIRDIWKDFTGTQVAALKFLSQFGVDKDGALTSDGLQGVTSAFNSWNELMTTLDDYSANITDIQKVTKEIARIDTKTIKDDMYSMYSNELSNVGINIAELTVDNIGQAFNDTTLGELIKNNPSFNVEALTGYITDLNNSYLKQIELTKQLNELKLKETLSQTYLAKELKDYEAQLKDLNSTVSVSFKGMFDPLLNALKSIKEMATDTVDAMDSQDIAKFWELDKQYKDLMAQNKFEEAQTVFGKISSISDSLYGSNDKFKADITDYMSQINISATAKENEINTSLMGGIGELYNLTAEQIDLLKEAGKDGNITNDELNNLAFVKDDLKKSLIDNGFIEANTILGSIEEYSRLQLQELQNSNNMETSVLSTDTFKYLDYVGKKEQYDIASTLGKSFNEVEDFILGLQSFDIKNPTEDLAQLQSMLNYTFNAETGKISYDQTAVTDLSKLWETLPQDVKDAYGTLNTLAKEQQVAYLSDKKTELTNQTATDYLEANKANITEAISAEYDAIINQIAKEAEFNAGAHGRGWDGSAYNILRSLGLTSIVEEDDGNIIETSKGATATLEARKQALLSSELAKASSTAIQDISNLFNTTGVMGWYNHIGTLGTDKTSTVGLEKYFAESEDLLKLIQSYQQTQLPSFAVGTANVPHDMIAQIHKGETIIPSDFAESIRQGQMTLGNNSYNTNMKNVENYLALVNDKLGKLVITNNTQLTTQRNTLGVLSGS